MSEHSQRHTGGEAVPLQSGPRLKVTFWGVRGTVPSPGRSTHRYGGNTPCIEIGTGSAGSRLLFDAGTGLRPAGDFATRSEQIDLFLTHTHWDHIQGFPFFAPLHDPSAVIHVYTPGDGARASAQLIAEQMDGTRFPVAFEQTAATTHFLEVDFSRPWQRDGLSVEGFPANHPGVTVGYRVSSERSSVVYFPDNAIQGDQQPSAGWYDDLIAFVQGADLLVHDAMFSEAEYRSRTTWGHSTFDQALQLAMRANVATLCLFHHDPNRSDDALDAVVDELRFQVRRAGSSLRVIAASEGVVLDV